MDESQVNLRSSVEKTIEINLLVLMILKVKVKRRILELNRLKYPNFCSHDNSFSPISNPDAILETSTVTDHIISVQFVSVYCEK